MPAFALKNNRSPWTAALPPQFLWQSWWLTVGLTIPFSHHLLAVNQACHPGAIDRAVSLRETCLSKPLYTVVDWVPSFFLSRFLSLFFQFPDSFPLMPIWNTRWAAASDFIMLPLFVLLQVHRKVVWCFVCLCIYRIYIWILYFCHITHIRKFHTERLNHFTDYVVKMNNKINSYGWNNSHLKSERTITQSPTWHALPELL